MRPIFRVLALAVFVPPAAAASAQDAGAAVDMTGMYIYGMEDAVMEAAGAGKKTKVARTIKVPSLSFTPSLARRKQNLAAFVARTKEKSPAAAADLQKLFGSKDIIAEMGKAMAPYGLRTDNVADAYAIWWMIAYKASKKQEVRPSRPLFTAVKGQAARALSGLKATGQMGEAAKQQLAEACLIQAILIDGMMEGARGNDAQLAQVAQAVRQGAKNSGLNLEAFELTANGFTLKR